MHERLIDMLLLRKCEEGRGVDLGGVSGNIQDAMK